MERTEKIGLGVAVAGHGALLVALSVGIAARSDLAVRPDPISVQLADEVSLESTAPNPADEVAAAVAPELGETATPPEPPSEAIAQVEPRPTPPRPAPAPSPSPASQPRAERPPERAQPRREERRPAPRQERRGGSRLGDNFLEGTSDEANLSKSQASSASEIGPAVKTSLQREVYRQLKPHWQAPSGADVEKLRTELSIRLDRNGNIQGQPVVLRTTGQTPSNAAQVKLHQERAVRAAQLAAPFNLPDQYYEAWKLLEPIGFYTGL